MVATVSNKFLSLMVVVLFLLIILPANAQVTTLDPVPYGDERIDAHEAAILRATESRLRIRLRSLQRVGEIFNSDCASVKVGSSRFKQCQTRFSQLELERQKYNNDAKGFNVMLAVALGSAQMLSGNNDSGSRSAERTGVLDATITIRRGNITRSSSQSFGTPFVAGEEVRTSPDALVDIIFGNGDMITLGGNTVFHFAKEGEGPLGSIDFSRGKIISIIQCLKDRETCRRVQTRNASFSVRGTLYDLQVAEDGTVTLIVLEGIVTVEIRKNGESIDLIEFQQMTMTFDGAVNSVTEVDAGKYEIWWY